MISPRGRGNDGGGEAGESGMSLGVRVFTDRDSTDRREIKSDIDLAGRVLSVAIGQSPKN